MTGLSKLFSTLLLLAAGFFGASMFGPPELTERLIGQWATPPMEQGEGLRPLSPGQLAAPVQAEPRFIPAPLPDHSPAAPVQVSSSEPTRAQPTAWQTPDFAAKPLATPDSARGPLAGPSADFNAWLGAAGNWLDRENETAPMSPSQRYQRDTAVAPVAGFDEPASSQATVAWLPPRDANTSSSNGPSLFAANSNEQAVGRDSIAADPWGTWNTTAQPVPSQPAPSKLATSVDFPAQLGPAPFDSPGRTYEAGYAPVARAATQTNYGTHVVTDGDTLPALAKRYLGDAARAEELYQLNRDRLDHPDLLPIGLVLRMPDEPRRKATPPVSDWSQQQSVRNGPFSTVSSGADIGDEPSRMVPVGAPEEAPARLPNAMYADEWSW